MSLPVWRGLPLSPPVALPPLPPLLFFSFSFSLSIPVIIHLLLDSESMYMRVKALRSICIIENNHTFCGTAQVFFNFYFIFTYTHAQNVPPLSCQMMVRSLLLHVKINLACRSEPHGCLISLCCGGIRVRSLSGLNRSLPKPLIYHGPLAQTVSSQTEGSNMRLKFEQKQTDEFGCRCLSGSLRIVVLH